MDLSESQALFLKFAEPLAAYAAFSVKRKQMADTVPTNCLKIRRHIGFVPDTTKRRG